MRTILILITATALVAGLAQGCGPAGTGAATTVVAGFYPLAFAAEEVTRGRVEVTNLAPPGSEPHDLEISPRDVAAVQQADVVLLLGQGFQPQLEDAAGSGDNVIQLLDDPRLRLRAGDPHVWLDPARFALVARRIAAALGELADARDLEGRLEALDEELQRGLAECDRRELVTSHEAFGYLAERYGLEQIAVAGLTPEAEAEPSRLRDVVDLVRERGVTTVFVEPLVSPRLAETIARETGTRTAVLDPIEGLTEADQAAGADYFTLMRRNLDALRTGLECR